MPRQNDTEFDGNDHQQLPVAIEQDRSKEERIIDRARCPRSSEWCVSAGKGQRPVCRPTARRASTGTRAHSHEANRWQQHFQSKNLWEAGQARLRALPGSAPNRPAAYVPLPARSYLLTPPSFVLLRNGPTALIHQIA
jgi:hypothetical protein